MPVVQSPAQQHRRSHWHHLLLRAQQGQASAFGLLFEEMTPYLLRRLRACSVTEGLFTRPQDVEDTLQDARFAAWRALSHFDGARGRAAGWIWVITRNCAINYLRDRTRRRVRSLYGPDGRLAIEPADSRTDPGCRPERADAGTVQQALEEELIGLRTEVRLAWKLRSEEGLSYDEIAARMGEPRGTIATWLHRLREAVRQRLR
jgi:RNA polymerase sigma-70 factor (ECF subfamily)